MINPFKVGDIVWKNYSFDGTPKQGYPDKRRVFTITKISDHDPSDGPGTKDAVCYLYPGVTWSFFWNLTLRR